MDFGGAAPAVPDKVATLRLGVRFLVFAQPPFIPGYESPETVWLTPSPGEVLAGPADRGMYVVDPLAAKQPYRFPELPPYAGALRPPVSPGPEGHFDHVKPGSRGFLCAHAYACVRRVLDICEGYVGGPVPWFFRPQRERLEIVPLIDGWPNAQSGFGFLELGESPEPGANSAFALNFDAIAHETGHLVLLGEMGLPQAAAPGLDFLSYHEAVADFVSMLGLLHFDTALDRVLRRTQGDLLLHNELDLFAETSNEKQLRSFSNSLRLGDVSDDVHDRSRPFSGALFDALLEVHQGLLYERGLSPLDPRRFADLRRQMSASDMRALLAPDPDYQYRHFAVKAALQEARDIIGEALVRSWRHLEPDTMTFATAAEGFLTQLDRSRGRRFAGQAEDCFAWRAII